MPQSIYRTHATDLSDGELALLDVLFKYRADFRCLRRKGFVERFNHRSHGFDDAELREVLQKLCRRNVLGLWANSSAYCMTEIGGDNWSSERCPVWEKYASERYGQLRSGKETISIVATAPDTLDEILTIGRDIGMWELNRARIRRAPIRNHELLPWRPFPILHVAVAIINPYDEQEDVQDQDIWECEKRRTWWRNIFELQKLLGADHNHLPSKTPI